MLEMDLNTFYQLYRRYFDLSGKFQWLIQQLLLVINDFRFLNLLKYQVYTNFDIFSYFSIKNNTERSWKWA